MDAYARDKARVLDGRVAVVGLDDPVAAGLLSTAAAPVQVGFPGSREPAPGESACVTAFSSTTRSATTCASPRRRPIPVAGPVGVLNALAAAALATLSTCRPRRIAAGAAAFQVEHGIAPRSSIVIDGVTYVDDSKATQPARGAGVDRRVSRAWCG